MPEAWTVLKVLDWTADRFARAGLDSPRLEAQVLLGHVLECSRVSLYTSFDKPLAEDELAAYRELIRRRLGGEPMAYLTGTQEFWSREFAVSPAVLIPRRDTETLIEAVLDRWPHAVGDPRVADVGTGSGIIAITLAAEKRAATVLAIDASDEACALARANAARHEVGDRVEVVRGHLLDPAGDRQFHVIAANLPYVRESEMASLQVEVQREPRSALVSGADGLDLIRELITAAPARLEAGGWLVLEHGFDQGPAVRALLEDRGFEAVSSVRDLGDRERVTLGQWNCR